MVCCRLSLDGAWMPAFVLSWYFSVPLIDHLCLIQQLLASALIFVLQD